jgi:predicted XRE-type DNA-binding protein
VDLSDLLRKLSDLSSERSGGHKEGGFQLRGEEIARLAKLLGMNTSRISELLGKDIARLSKLVGENIKINARVNFLGMLDRTGTHPRARERRAANGLGRATSHERRR